MGAEDFLLNFILRARDDASHVMHGFAGNAKKVAHDAQLAIGGIGLAALGATVAAVKMAEDFDVPMRKVLSLTGISADEFQHYKDQVLDLSTVVPKSATDLANGLYYVVSAGFQGADAMNILEYSAKAAAAGLTDTKTVADAVTSALNAYKLTGKDAANVTDQITEAVLQGKTEYGALAGSIGRVLPIAAQLHVGLDEVLASMSTMTRVGLNADEAATALRATLNTLVKPSSGASKELALLGLSAAGLRDELKSKGLLAVLQELMDKTGGNVEILGKIIPNVRALTGVLATAGGQSEAYAKILGSMKDAAGLTNDAFKKTSEGTSASIALLKNNLAAIAITIGDVLLPPFAELTGHIAAVVKQVHTWMEQNPKLAEMIAKGLALVAVFGTLAGGAATLGAAIGFVGTHLGGMFLGISGVSHGLLAFLGPIGLVIAAVIALKIAYDNNIGPVVAVVDRLKSVWMTFTEMFRRGSSGDVEGALKYLNYTFGVNLQGVMDFFIKARDTIAGALAGIIGYIKPFMDTAFLVLSRFWTEIQPKLAAAWGAISEFIKAFVNNVIMPLVRNLVEFWKTHWDQIELVLRTAWILITDVIRIAWDVISGIFKVALDLISGNWKGVWDDISTTFKNVWEDVGRFLSDYFTKLIPTIRALALDLGKAIVAGIIEGLGNLKTAVGNAIGGALGSVIQGAKDVLGIHSPSAVFAEMGEQMSLGMAQGVGRAAASVAQAVAGLSGMVAATPSGLGPQGALTGSAGSGYGGTIQFVLPVYIDGQKVSEKTTSMSLDDFLVAIRESNWK